MFRIDYVSHVVFFRRTPYGVRIIPILHERQLPDLYTFDDEGDE